MNELVEREVPLQEGVVRFPEPPKGSVPPSQRNVGHSSSTVDTGHTVQPDRPGGVMSDHTEPLTKGVVSGAVPPGLPPSQRPATTTQTPTSSQPQSTPP